MTNASFALQTKVYFNKISRISLKEKCWKFIAFAAIISLLVAAVVGKDMFTTYESTKSGFFSIASAGIWIGIFNSIQVICKEHNIIRSEYRSGMRISSYVMAHVLWQFIICLVQSIVIMTICLFFVDFNKTGILISSAIVEYFITILLVTFGSDLMGIMISSIAGTPMTAMTIMPFILILQLIMSGVLFDLSGWSQSISYITFSKWGMSAFGSIANLNSDKYSLNIAEFFPEVYRLETEDCYKHTAANLMTAWGCCLLLCFICIIVSIISLKLKNHDS